MNSRLSVVPGEDVLEMGANPEEKSVRDSIEYAHQELERINKLDFVDAQEALKNLVNYLENVTLMKMLRISEDQRGEIESILGHIQGVASDEHLMNVGMLYANLEKGSQWQKGRYSPQNLTVEELAAGKREEVIQASELTSHPRN